MNADQNIFFFICGHLRSSASKNKSATRAIARVLITASLLFGSAARGEQLTVDASAAPALSAVAIDTASGGKTTGTMSGGSFTFDLKAGRHYDIALGRVGGGVLKLIDLSWYNDQPPTAAPEAMGDDDRQAIKQIVTDIKQFTNHNQIVALVGDSQRAAALMDLRRDSDFHSRQGGEIIRRIEVWYFENQAGGWAKVQQEDRLIDRQRFASADEFEKAYASETWQAVASGLSIEHGKASTVKVDLAATTRPAK